VVLLKPLPYPEPDRIMQVGRLFPNGVGNSSSVPKFNAWKKNDVFEAMAAYDFAGPGMNVGGSDHPEQVKGIHVSVGIFRVFGVSPAIGRTFTAGGLPGGPKVAVISYQLFSRRLGGDPAGGKVHRYRRRAHHGGRSHAGRFSVRSAGGYLHPLAGRSEQHQSGPLSAGRRTPQAGCHAAGRQGADEDRRRAVPAGQSQVDG
jgi:hypothetical protein